MIRAIRTACLIGALAASGVLGTGCASSSTAGTMKSYASSFNAARAGYGLSDQAAIDAVYGKDSLKTTGAGMLANWEMAAAHHSVGQWAESREHFLKATSISRDLEERAVVSGGDAAKVAGSLLTNDNALEFKGDAYEKVMAHTLNALNFLALGDLDGARVEIRKADEYQKAELERHARALDRAAERDKSAMSAEEKERARAEKERDAAVRSQPAISGEYQKMSGATAKVKNSFQNPFTYYLSGVVYEVLGELDDASIDYARAAELSPESVPIRDALARVREVSPAPNLSGGLAGESGPMQGTPSSDSAPPAGEVIVIYEMGFVPQKQEVKFPLPMPNGSLGFTAFPVYTDYTASSERLEVGINGISVTTEPVVDVHALAVKALQEKWFAIASRELVRLVAKELAQEVAQQQARKIAGNLGGLLASIGGAIYKSVTQNADLRAFYGLPQQVQIARVRVPAGDYVVPLRRIQCPTPSPETSVNVNVQPSRKSVVVVRGLPNAPLAFSFVAGA